MRLTKIRIRGYQSFTDSGVLNLADGINLIIGQNNAGKSALLRALLPDITDDKHRTPERWQDFKLPTPKIEFTISTTGRELKDWMLRSGRVNYIPIKSPSDRDVTSFMDEFLALPDVQVSVSRVPNVSFTSNYPSHGLFLWDGGAQQVCASATPNNGELSFNSHYAGEDSLPALFNEAWRQDMFYFAAERLTIGESGQGYADRLRSDAGNLPNVLHTLNNERGDVFRRLVLHVQEIFSTVGNISIRTKPENNNLEVRIWPTESMERVQLSFPLNSSGTGVSQVIALLTAIMTIDDAVIIIDEINSFLHPAAVKSLLRILQTSYANHQYLVSTHAPEVIGFSNPGSIHLVKRLGYESSVESLNLDGVERFRDIANHLGVSMSDVFAADRVIWVEGATEELCFPYIHQRLIGPVPRGTIITSVVATGDFNSNKRDAAIVFEVYKRLSSASVMLPVEVSFSFDTERLTDLEKTKMKRKAGGSLNFLPRRHFECYLLDENAICAFIKSKDPESSADVTPQIVATAMRRAAGSRTLRIPEWKDDLADTDWLSRVDAANLITEVCNSISNHRAPFAKKNDSLFLLEFLLENSAEKLSPLRDYVARIVKGAAAGR